MTGFEYTAAIGMLYEGQTKSGLTCVASVRNRYDGLRRNPYDEAECGHHYGRAMISWAELLALTGFQYSAIDREMIVTPRDGQYFWSNGYAYGIVSMKRNGGTVSVTLSSLHGDCSLKTFTLRGFGRATFDAKFVVPSGSQKTFEVTANDSKAGIPTYEL
jgi:hypothetical protein